METNNDAALGQVVVRTAAIGDLRIEQRAEGGDSRTISGYAVRFNKWSKPFWNEWVERIDPRALDGCDLSDVVMCTDHGTSCDDILARSRDGEGSLRIDIDAVGVKFMFDAPETTRGNDILALIRRGDVSECSFKFVVAEDRWSWRRDGSAQQYDERTILRIAKLYDLSIVVSGQYAGTSAAVERSAVDALRRGAASSADRLEVARARDFVCKINETN